MYKLVLILTREWYDQVNPLSLKLLGCSPSCLQYLLSSRKSICFLLIHVPEKCIQQCGQSYMLELVFTVGN